MSRYDWMEDARCAEVDPELWHPGTGIGYGAAVQVCQRCPVQRQCADHAARLEGDGSKRDRHGLFAGQSPRDRLASSDHVTRETNHDAILRLVDRGGMDAYQIAEHVGVDVRTVWRATKSRREQMRKAA